MENKHKPNHYVNNKKFQEELLNYHAKLKEASEKGEPDPIANDYIGKCILDIAYSYASKSKFLGYTNLWKEEMISDAIDSCVRYGIKSYNPEKYSNPLAYFTEVVHWSFVRRINREKKEQYMKLKSQTDNDLLLKLSQNSYKNENNEIADNLIKQFEDKIKASKLKKNPKKGIEAFIE